MVPEGIKGAFAAATKLLNQSLEKNLSMLVPMNPTARWIIPELYQLAIAPPHPAVD